MTTHTPGGDDPRGLFYRFAYAGFLIWATTFLWGPTGPYAMIPLLLAWFVYWCRTENPRASRSPLVWMVWLFVFYVAARAVSGYFADPSTLPEQDNIAADYFKVGGLWALLLAPWLTGSFGRSNRNILFALALLGFVGEAVQAVPWSDLDAFVEQRGRLVAGPNGTGTVAGFFFLLALIVGPYRIIDLLRRKRTLLTVVAILAWLALVSTLGSVILATQSRSAWLALGVSLPFALALGGWAASRHPSSERQKAPLLLSAIALAVLLGAVASQHQFIQKRFATVSDSIEKIVSLDVSELEPNSVSYRIWMYQFGLSKALEKPIIGQSPGGVKKLMEDADSESINRFTHLHNAHLEIFVGLGLIGFVLFYGAVGLCVIEVARAFRSARLPVEWMIFWMSATAFVGVEMLFDTRFFIYECGAVMVLLASLGIACHLERLRQVDTGGERNRGFGAGPGDSELSTAVR